MNNNTKEKVIELASIMFTTEGIKAVRMDDIAQRAGMSKRTLYEIFGDKDELIFLAISHHFDKFEIENETIGRSAPNVMIAFLMVMQNVIRRSEVNWLLIKTLRKFHSATYTRINDTRKDRHHTDLKRGLEYGVEAGVINPQANLDLAITMIDTIVTSVTLETHTHPLPESISPAQALYEMMVYFLRGIATPSGIDIIDSYTNNENNKPKL
ncbi:MAG: TetR/AcrR family transcriptional regulator [Rikenellaceae bacterium]